MWLMGRSMWRTLPPDPVEVENAVVVGGEFVVVNGETVIHTE